MKNYYDILNVSYDIEENELKKRYRELAKKYHPDKYINKTLEEQKVAEKRFTEVKEAYDILSDKNKKRDYDIKFFKKNKNIDEKNNNSTIFNKDLFELFNKKNIDNIFENFFHSKNFSKKGNCELKDCINNKFNNFFRMGGKK